MIGLYERLNYGVRSVEAYLVRLEERHEMTLGKSLASSETVLPLGSVQPRRASREPQR